MLILTRKMGERLIIDGPCEVVVLRTQCSRVKLGIKAKDTVDVIRGELQDKEEAA